jgi:hypothetical protein
MTTDLSPAYCHADLPYAPGADPHCYYCEGCGCNPDAEEQSDPCPVCMEDLLALGLVPEKLRAPEKYEPLYEDVDKNALLDGVEFLEAKYYRGVLVANLVHTIVLHQGVSGASVADYFHRAPDKRVVSSHFEVRSNGDIVQCVPLNRVAFHAPPLNHTSFGIELQGPFGKVWPADQIIRTVGLCWSLIKLYPTIKYIRPHSSISKHRRDPGSPRYPFPWYEFQGMGVAVLTKGAF